jgi:N-acetyl-1-D-myo-inositol-2-amino-2-deoxy-alpha-D-glucopyranoside deacetylase
MTATPHTGPRPTMLITVAHPDDESFGCGSVIASATRLGLRVVLCCATHGEAGEDATGESTDPAALGARRAEELRTAAEHLGVDEIELLDFADSGWDGPPPAGALVDSVAAATAAVQELLTRHRPSVVVTMDPSGSDGHRDHAAIGAATTAAFAAAVDWPASLYHWCLPRSLMAKWAAVREGIDAESVYLTIEIGRPDADITTVIDTSAVLEARRRAIAAHVTQTSPFVGLPDDVERAFLTADHLVRIAPPWPGGDPEDALLVP